MKFWLRRRRAVLSIAAASLLALSLGHSSPAPAPPRPAQSPPEKQEEIRLPNGKLQRDEILKAEHEQNVKDAAQLVEMARQLELDIEKNDRFVFSLSTLKKTDDIEKLVRKIRARLRHS